MRSELDQWQLPRASPYHRTGEGGDLQIESYPAGFARQSRDSHMP